MKNFLWMLLDKPNNKEYHIKIDKDDNVIVTPNLEKVYFSEIKEIKTSLFKNYIKLISIYNREYYYKGSISKLLNITKDFIRISRTIALNYCFITARLDDSFVFIDKTPYKIGRNYRKLVKHFFREMEEKQI